jgi:hypothetical protein
MPEASPVVVLPFTLGLWMPVLEPRTSRACWRRGMERES